MGTAILPYWAEFDKQKIVYQEIQFHPCYACDMTGMYGNNKTFLSPSPTFTCSPY